MVVMKVKEKIYETFDKCQHGHQNQTKLADGLKSFYENSSPKNQKEFRKEFLIHLKQCMVIFSREPAVERCMEFVARFASKFAATGDEEEDPTEDDNFYLFLFDFLLQHHSAHGRAVRFRVCHLVNLMLQVMPREATLDENLVDDITNAMLTRMYDIFPSIRSQAVRALNRLQQPTSSHCPVIERYRLLLRCDESADVRSSVLQCIALNSITLPEIIRRVRDAKESVRKLAYQVLAQKVSIKALACSRRLYLIEQGLLDQSESVRTVVKTQLLQAWLRTYEGNILEVLEKLDCVGSTKITCMAVDAMFKFGKLDDIVTGFTILNERKVIDLDKLTPQSSLYWAQLCQFLRYKGVECEDYLDSILPTVTDFCKYLEEYFDSSMVINEDWENSAKLEDKVAEGEFIAGQLLQIVSGYDLFDDAGRRRLKETIIKLTSNIDVTNFTCIVPSLAKCLKVLHDSDHEDERVQIAAEMIQDAREKIPDSPAGEMPFTEEEIRTKQIQLAKIRVKIIELNEDLDEQIRATEFAQAAETQKLIDELKSEKIEMEESMKPNGDKIEEEDKPTELKNDPATILKCLQIVKEVCSSIAFFSVTVGETGKVKKRKKTLHPTLLTLVNSLILPSIANPIPAIREVAVECLGNCCLYSLELSAQHLPLFLQIIQADVVEVRIKALGGIVDILRIYGMEAFAPKKKDAKKKRQEDIDDVEAISKETDDGDEEDIEDEEAYITTLILTKIVEMLDEENADIRHAAASSLAMILVSGRVVSPAIFSRLMLLWYNPMIQDEHKTINKISSFLDFYPYMCRTTHDCIEEAVLPTLRTLFNAPNSSPLASVKVNNVAELLVYLTKPSIIKSLHTDANKGSSDSWKQRINWIGESSAHDGLAIKLSNEVLRDPQSINVNVLARTLSLLELSSNLQDNLKDLTVLCEQMLEVVKNKQATTYLRKFQRNVLSLVLVRSDTPVMEPESPLLETEDQPVIENGSEENTTLPLNGDKNEETEQLMIRRRAKSSQSTDQSSICSQNSD